MVEYYLAFFLKKKKKEGDPSIYNTKNQENNN